jgi:hypothetical protein
MEEVSTRSRYLLEPTKIMLKIYGISSSILLSSDAESEYFFADATLIYNFSFLLLPRICRTFAWVGNLYITLSYCTVYVVFILLVVMHPCA